MPGHLSWDYLRFRLAREFGWTFDEIDNMSIRTVRVLIGFLDGESSAQRIKRELKL